MLTHETIFFCTCCMLNQFINGICFCKANESHFHLTSAGLEAMSLLEKTRAMSTLGRKFWEPIHTEGTACPFMVSLPCFQFLFRKFPWTSRTWQLIFKGLCLQSCASISCVFMMKLLTLSIKKVHQRELSFTQPQGTTEWNGTCTFAD